MRFNFFGKAIAVKPFKFALPYIKHLPMKIEGKEDIKYSRRIIIGNINVLIFCKKKGIFN
jgi:hypothetical protein